MVSSGYWVIRTYEAGNVGEKIKFWIPDERPTKSLRKMKSDIKKQAQNEASATKRLARVINANFSHGDVLLGLDYSDEGLSQLEQRAGIVRTKKRGRPRKKSSEEEAAEMDAMRKAAEQELRNALRRVKRAMEADGLSLRYVAITSDMDGKTGETKRLHHHLIVPEAAVDYFRNKWTAGGCHDSRLRRMDDYTPLAEYLLLQVRRVPDEKKYMTSRNLIRVMPQDRVARNGSLLRAPKGSILLHTNEFSRGEAQYIRYIIKRKE